VVNLGYMSLETAQRVIVETARSPDYQMTPLSARQFADFALASRVHASLLLSGELAQARVDITARDGDVAISGTIPDWASEEEILERIQKLPGVKRVRGDLTNLSPSLGLGD